MLKIIPAPLSLGGSSPGTQKAPQVILEATLRSGLEHNAITYQELPEVHTSQKEDEENSPTAHHLRTIVGFNKQIYTTSLKNIEKTDQLLCDHPKRLIYHRLQLIAQSLCQL